MNKKDIALLGFLYSAADYLKENYGDFDGKNYDLFKKEVINLIDDPDDKILKIKSDYFEAGKKTFNKYFDMNKDITITDFKDIFENNKQHNEYNHLNKDVFNTADQFDDEEEEMLRKISYEATKNVKDYHDDSSNKNVKELDRIFNEIVDYESMSHDIYKNCNNPDIIERNDKYVSDLMKELSKSKLTQKNSQRALDKIKIYESLAQEYPYLSGSFIRTAYSLKKTISTDYKNDVPIILLHRIVFKDLEDLHKFIEIVMLHDYSVNVDENKMIVDALKKFVNKDGAILTNIFDIANQAYLLKGEYDGFKVIY